MFFFVVVVLFVCLFVCLFLSAFVQFKVLSSSLLTAAAGNPEKKSISVGKNLERFSIECSKTKTKVITTANQN